MNNSIYFILIVIMLVLCGCLPDVPIVPGI